jgi:N-acetyl-alpha-D-muramate 1-phosphate uridylyltransferase
LNPKELTLPPVAILAGGLATRLRPLTEKFPKALVEVAGRPFIDWQLELLARSGLRNVVLCLGYKGEMIEEYVGNGQRFGLAVTYSYDGATLLGTGGAIRKALPGLGADFFVLYGDSYLLIDYKAVAEAFRAGKRPGLMTVYRNDSQWDTSNVLMEGANVRVYDKVARIPGMRHIDYGLSLFSRDVFTSYDDSARFDLSVVMTQLVTSGKMTAFEVSERFYEIGTPSGIADLERLLLRSSAL